MSKTLRRLALAPAALTLAVAGLVAAPTTASAGENLGRVRNYAGEPVKIRCDYGKESTSHYLIEKYGTNPKANSTYWCDSLGGDTDQFRSNNDQRCLRYDGPGAADGWYRMDNAVWFKVDGLALAKVYPYTSDRCGGKPWFNHK